MKNFRLRTFFTSNLYLLALSVWMILPCTVNAAEPSGPEIVVDLDTEVGEMYNFWDVYPVTVQSPFLDERQFDELKQTYRYAKYINCVRLFGGKELKKDDYFRGRDDKGQAICDFSGALAMLSGIRKCGFTPWIVLDNVPAKMCANPKKGRYGNTRPPADFELWGSYVRQFTESLVSEFGQDEVAEWRFRVGTEPDFKGHWTGTKQQYIQHYDHTVAAVRSVLPEADIGPGNVMAPMKSRREKSWAPAMIDHCASGTNHVSAQTGTPLRFFGSSYYTSVGRTDEQFDSVVKFLRDKLDDHPQLKDVPVEIHEFGILNDGKKRIVGDGTEFGGSWLAHMANKIYQNRVRRVYQWSWNTDKKGNRNTPIAHVMDALEEMAGGSRLSVTTSRSSEEDHVGCIAAKRNGRIDLIVFRHLAKRANGDKVPVRLTLGGDSLGKNNWTVTRAHLLDGEHAGSSGELHSVDPLPKPTFDSTGRMHFDLMLDGHAVVFLQLKEL